MQDDINFNRIMAGLTETVEIAEGRAEPARMHAPAEIDVKAIRAKTGLSQAAFAARYGFTLGAIRDWEQKRRRPEASARILLKVIEMRPEVVEAALEVA
jgi:putative transcriptional regulator